MIDYRNDKEARHNPRTLIEYGAGLYYGLIDIEFEVDYYELDTSSLSDIETIELLITTVEELNEYDKI